MKPKAFLYRDDLKFWRWKVVMGNKFESKKIVAASTESYKRRAKCIENYMLIVGLTRIPLWDESGAQKRITKSTGKGYDS